ncbi:MAG: SGNH/GDSL hydrolase family protein [Clostridia bacterium]|nr:SGNH/GDSL hydrolase family protein [Clostridia bacterium]
MKLSCKQLQEIALGAVKVYEENEAVYFNRFTEEQTALYKKSNGDFYNKSFTTAGVRLSFKTNSERLFLKIATTTVPSRQYFSFDVFVNGKLLGHLDNFSDSKSLQNYTQEEFPRGEFSKNFVLGTGEKAVCIYFPWSVGVALYELSLDDGALVLPSKPEKKILAFGDSITHGYDAMRPSNRYMSRLCDALGAEEINKAIGGEMFFPPLAALADDFTPDYITVAYGTNDWNNISRDAFLENCRKFYETLRETYPTVKIFAISPIWRKEMTEQRKYGDFMQVEKDIFEIVNSIKDVVPVSGFGFVPHEERYYGDFRLHPNDEGFQHYFENLYRLIREFIK